MYYVQYLVQQIGEPPDLMRAAQLTQQLELIIRVVGPQRVWTSEPLALPDTPELPMVHRDVGEKMSMVSININQLVHDVVSQYQEDKPGVRVTENNVTRDLVVDAKRIKMVLRNVLENALKYSIHQDQTVEVTLYNINAAGLQIRIKDYGQGIPAEDIAHVFEPFYRVDKSRNAMTGGYGLGLSLCQKIMQAHGGDIEITSQVGIGTTVTLSVGFLSRLKSI